jgi:hypothetical protein
MLVLEIVGMWVAVASLIACPSPHSGNTLNEEHFGACNLLQWKMCDLSATLVQEGRLILLSVLAKLSAATTSMATCIRESLIKNLASLAALVACCQVSQQMFLVC